MNSYVIICIFEYLQSQTTKMFNFGCMKHVSLHLQESKMVNKFVNPKMKLPQVLNDIYNSIVEDRLLLKGLIYDNGDS